MNKEMLEQLLKSKYGEDFDTSLITDEDLQTMSGEDDTDVDEDDVNDNDNTHHDDNDEENGRTDEDNTDDEDNNEDDEFDEELDLDSIDFDTLTDNEKIFFKYLKKEKEARLDAEINAIVGKAELTDAQKKVINMYSKTSKNVAAIKEMVADLEKENVSIKRKSSGVGALGKNNFKMKTTKNKVKKPSFGTKEFGAMLAKK